MRYWCIVTIDGYEEESILVDYVVGYRNESSLLILAHSDEVEFDNTIIDSRINFGSKLTNKEDVKTLATSLGAPNTWNPNNYWI